MKLNITARPLSKEAGVEKIDEVNFIVSVKEPPVQGRANAGIIRALAEHFHVAPSRVRIVSGYTSRKKIIEVL